MSARYRHLRALFLMVLIAETGPVTDRLRVREIDDDEGDAGPAGSAVTPVASLPRIREGKRNGPRRKEPGRDDSTVAAVA